MAKTGGNFERCNVGSVEAHNLRTEAYLKGVQESGRNLYFFQDLTKNNSSYVNPTYEGKTCNQIFQDLVQLYKSKIGQMPQLKDREWIDKKTGKKKKRPGWSPIREAVLPIKADTTLKDFDKLVAWLRQKGVEVIRIDLHKDEGYENVTGKRKMNYHAHLVVDWINHETANTAKLTPADMSEFQTMCAVSLDMERGTPKTVTGKQHLDSAEYREKAAEQHLAEMTGAGAKLAAFFGVGELAEIRKELKEAKEERDVAVKDKETALKALRYNIKVHGDELATEKEKSRQRGISEAVEAINKETNLKAASPADVVTAYKKALNTAKIASDSLQEQKKLTRSKEDIPARVNQILKEYHLPTLDEKGLQEAEKVAKKSPFPFLGGYYARQELCQAIIDFCRQRQAVLNGDNTADALKLLRQLWETLRQLWEGIMRGLQAVKNVGAISPGEAYDILQARQGREFTKQAVIEDVEQQLRFTPFVVDTDKWEEALRMTPEQILAQYQTTARQQSDVEQDSQEQHIDQEQTRQNTWHR